MAFERISAKELRLGLYIKLVGSWFSHPFPTNTFKIKSNKELTTLRSLRNIKILYDPVRSDHVTTQSSDENLPENLGTNLEDRDQVQEEESASPGYSKEERAQRAQAFEERREQLKQAERKYQEVLVENKQLMREVTCGYVKGMRKAERLLGLLGTILGNDGSLLALMNLCGANEIGDEFYYHSLNTAILSMVVARELGLSQDEIQMIGMGAMFHDIGETATDVQIISKGQNVSKKQEEAHKRHPLAGKRMIEKGFGVPAPSLTIIQEHHERMNGSGYPHHLREESIHLFSKITMVADAYDDLCNNPELEKCLTPYEAVSTLYLKRGTEFWEEAVVTLIHCLGVYPPSTLVELNDGSFGIVCSINPHDRLRPMVLIYSPDIPKNEALIVNLGEEPELSINKSLRPHQIPLTVWNYLNPRGMIKYFAFDAGTTKNAFENSGRESLATLQ